MIKRWWQILTVGCIILVMITACKRPSTEIPEPTATATQLPKPTPTTTPTPVPQGLIVVNASETRQVIKDIGGGNFIHKYSGRDEVLDAVGKMNVDTLGTRYARVWMGLKDWESENDNNDPEDVNWEAFQDEGYTNRTFHLMQDFQDRGMVIIATIWEVPDWMVYEPESDRARWIPPENYPETLESITSWLLHARDAYGVDVDYISFNEPILGVSTALTSQEQRQMIKLTGTRFEELGIKTKWLLGDCAGISSCLMYSKYIYDDPEVKPFLGPLTVHSWDALGAKSTDITNIADFAYTEGLDLWVTEGGWDPFLYARQEEFPTWKNALRLSAVYNRILQLSRATVIMYWEFLGDDYSTNDGVHPYPVLDMLQLLTQSFPEGTTILQTGVNTSQVYAVAGKTPGGYVLHIVNTDNAVSTVKIIGMPDGRYAYNLSTAASIMQDVGVLFLNTDGLTFDLAPESVHVLSLQP